MKILGTSIYFPKHRFDAAATAAKLGADAAWIEQASGVRERFFAIDETASAMGAKAAHQALAAAGLEPRDVDAIVGVSGTAEQAIPCTAALIQRAMGLGDSGIPAFDVNSTCLSFVVGLGLVADAIAAGRYRRVLMIASERASAGIDWSDKESACLIGDGAAAVVVGAKEPGDRSKLVCSRLETYASGADLCRIEGGGSKHHPRIYAEDTAHLFHFQMNGRAVFKLAAQMLPDFVGRLLAPAKLRMSDIALVIPHQASGAALELVRRRLDLEDERFLQVIASRGNTVGASIPMALHTAIETGRLQRGQSCLLLGTSAGFSVGGLVFVY